MRRRRTNEAIMATRMKVKKGDQVMVISGKDKGKRGRVIEVLTKKRKVLVEGLNILKHHERQNRQRGVAGGIDRKSTRLNSSHLGISYAVFCLKKKINNKIDIMIKDITDLPAHETKSNKYLTTLIDLTMEHNMYCNR